jgi:hypothetical protein
VARAFFRTWRPFAMNIGIISPIHHYESTFRLKKD